MNRGHGSKESSLSRKNPKSRAERVMSLKVSQEAITKQRRDLEPSAYVNQSTVSLINDVYGSADNITFHENAINQSRSSGTLKKLLPNNSK